MNASGHDWPGGGKEHAADAQGVVVEQERLVDDEGVQDEKPLRRGFVLMVARRAASFDGWPAFSKT